MKYPGLFITIEGIDGSGKSTLARDLTKTLTNQGHTVCLTQEPGGTTLGTTLRSLVNSAKTIVNPTAEFLLFAADRAQHVTEIIIPHLQQGHLVISDRYADSSLAYQGYGRGLDKAMITSINQWATQGLIPDLTLFIKINPSQVLERVCGRKEELTAFEQEKQTFWQHVAGGYETMFSNRSNVITLDGTKTPTTLCQEAVEHIKRMIKK